MRITALVAVAALLALSVGGPLSTPDHICCAKTMSHDIYAHGAGPCVGSCSAVVQASKATVGTYLIGALVIIPPRHSLPLLAHPIEKPPA
jgi:hypothetical protein